MFLGGDKQGVNVWFLQEFALLSTTGTKERLIKALDLLSLTIN